MSKPSTTQCRLSALPHQGERREQSCDGLSRLQGTAENSPPRNSASLERVERCVPTEHPPPNLGDLLRHPETTEQHVRLLSTTYVRQNRPYHLKNDRIEDLGRTSTNIIATTLFSDNSVYEYEAIYFK